MADKTSAVVVSRIAWTTLASVSLVGFMASIELTIIALALEDIRAAFSGESESSFSWIFNAYNITVAAVLLPAGWFGDRLGRQTVFCAGVVIFAIGSLLSGLAPSLDFLVAARVLQAVGGGLQVPAGMALVLAAFPPERRQFAIGVWAAAGGAAAALGPSVGAILVDLAGWRAVFLINVPVAAFILCRAPRWLLPDGPDSSLGRVDLVAVPMASIGVGAIVLGIVRAKDWGWADRNTLLCFVIGAVLIIGFVTRSLRHPRPLFDLGLVRLRSFWSGAIGQTAFVAAFFLWFIPLPTFLRSVWGWSVLKAGFAIAPGPVLAAAVAPFTGKVADAVGARIPLVVSGLTGVIGVALQSRYLTVEPNYVVGLLLPMLFIGFSAGIAFAATMGAVVAEVGPKHFSAATAARSTIYQLSVAVAIALSFTIIGRPESPNEALDAIRGTWIVAMTLYAAQFLFFFTLYPSRDELKIPKR